MNIDRIAAAMTGGRPRAGFTARVMAPIEGRPQPGFTARVMGGLPVGRGFSPGMGRRAAQPFRPAFSMRRAALLLVPAALAIAAGTVVTRASRVTWPSVPDAPQVRVAQAFRPANQPAIAQAFAPAEAEVAQAFRPAKPSLAQAAPVLRPIYMIAALEGPEDIAMKSIDPAACTIPALEGPAPLSVPDLPGNPGGSQKFREKP